SPHYPSTTSSISTLVHLFSHCCPNPPPFHSFPTRRSSDLSSRKITTGRCARARANSSATLRPDSPSHFSMRSLALTARKPAPIRSEEHTSELQSLRHLVCRLLLEKKKKKQQLPEIHQITAY